MNSPSRFISSRLLLSFAFIASLILTPNLAKAQNYTEEEYKVFEDIKAEKDGIKKVDMIVDFLKEKPKNDLRQYMTPEYQKVMVDLKSDKKWSQIITLGEKFLTCTPGDNFTEGALANAYYETNNMKGFVMYAERAYAAKPNSDLAMTISRAYQKLGNDPKALQWKEKVLSADPDNIEVLIEAMKKNMANQNMAQALKYARQCLDALPTAKKPADADAAAWKSTVDNGYAIAYGVVGQDAFQKNRFGEAIKNLESAVKYYKRYDGAYYALGMSYWQTRKLDAAMLNFAKAYVIKGPASNSAKQQLDKIFKSSRVTGPNQTRIIERAQQDLK